MLVECAEKMERGEGLSTKFFHQKPEQKIDDHQVRKGRKKIVLSFKHLPLIDVTSCCSQMPFLKNDDCCAHRGIYRELGLLCLSCLPVIGGKATAQQLGF